MLPPTLAKPLRDDTGLPGEVSDEAMEEVCDLWLWLPLALPGCRIAFFKLRRIEAICMYVYTYVCVFVCLYTYNPPEEDFLG